MSMIQVNNLHYSYPGAKVETLHGLNLEIGKGEVFGFLGPSGAGKSTMQKILIGSLKQYTGTAKAWGKEIKRMNMDFYERIGVAFEFPNFYNKLTAIENLRLFQSLYAGPKVNLNSLLAKVGLESAANLRFTQLSKGMRMRLNFCRAILHNPDILFLDEPTSGLDPINAKIMMDLILEKKAEGTTIVITTHNMKAADELCDRVAFIVDGEIKLINSPRELKLRLGQKRVRVEYLEKNQTLIKEFALDQLGANEAFLRLLKQSSVETIHSLEATLEQVFIDVTGRTLA